MHVITEKIFKVITDSVETKVDPEQGTGASVNRREAVPRTKRR